LIDRRVEGRRFEDLACEYLKAKGYRIQERNVRLVRKEVDIVAADGDTIVFIEVKGRRSRRFGSGSEAVGPRKRLHLLMFAAAYLERRGLWKRACRFDVVAIEIDAAGKPFIEHVENAFGE
jgi:putative endonuclease